MVVGVALRLDCPGEEISRVVEMNIPCTSICSSTKERLEMENRGIVWNLQWCVVISESSTVGMARLRRRQGGGGVGKTFGCDGAFVGCRNDVAIVGTSVVVVLLVIFQLLSWSFASSFVVVVEVGRNFVVLV